MTTEATHSVHPARVLWSALDGRRAGDLLRTMCADAGVEIGGSQPWDMQVHDDRLFARVLRDGTLGFGEAYMDGWWDAEALDLCVERLYRARLDLSIRSNWVLLAHAARARLLNLQRSRPREVAEKHYDIGNDLYQAMLDPRMVYTCGYWQDATDLEAAQQAKLELVCRKLGLQPGMRVLDLGCGWGGFAAYAARHHGVSVVGYNLSREQVALARQRCADLAVDIRLDDYRNAAGIFDAVVSIGLMEHVGPKNYRAYMDLVDGCLTRDGVALIHTIGGNLTRAQLDPWFDRYIFPNAAFPTMAAMSRAMEGRFVLEDVHNIGEHYDPTLMAWWQRFDEAWPRFRDRYGERFYRMWKFYLLTSAAGFRTRYLQLYQVVMTKLGRKQPAGARAR